MGIFLANPWGLVALAAIPATVAVHVLQERSRPVRASTLFLLERAAPTAAAGARIERFRQSLPFWMQVIAVTIAAWLLADPRIVRRDSRQTVAVVLDSSASMQACRERTLAALAARLPAWNAAAGTTDWHLLETGPRRPPLYAGPSLERLLQIAGEAWRPTLGTHDAAAALSLAESLGPAGTGAVILVTDHPRRVPEGVALLSAGEPFVNVGFAAGDVRDSDGHPRWRALVTNHGDAIQSRTVTAWLPGTDGAAGMTVGPAEQVAIEPGGVRTLEGAWPEGAGRLVLRLSPDRFTVDDVLPLVRPAPRTVRLARRLDDPDADLIERMALATEHVTVADTAAAADVVIDRLGVDPDRDAILLAAATAEPDAGGRPTGPTTYDAAWLSTEDHPLVNDLAWGGLLSGPAVPVALGPGDEPLVWKGGRPFAFLRRAAGPRAPARESLVLAFDVTRSTAARSPAVVVMIGRFLDRVRSRSGRPWAGNVDAGQALDTPAGDGNAAPSLTIEPVHASPTAAGPAERAAFQGRAPDVPSFFAVGRGEPIVSGATQFADARESDFGAAGPADTLDTLRHDAALKQSIEDPLTPLWLGALACALAVAWAAGNPGAR